ncbi:hypothetical protein [Neorhizobium alkalisoli]|uniref:hypothetical protein n=1 Tax=Neorhizobium alkalisoli TaxID=528178 RepID=UPI000CFA7570|nr:hypothetical protein [Neorhizobium alkalisoli]
MPYLVEILLPITKLIKSQDLEDLRLQLTDHFGGVTLRVNPPAEGLWDDGDTVERDRIVVVEVMTDELDRPWWAKYRRLLEAKFAQNEIVVRAMTMQRL